MVRVETKDVGEVCDKFDDNTNFKWQLENGNEKYIKNQLEIKE